MWGNDKISGAFSGVLSTRVVHKALRSGCRMCCFVFHSIFHFIFENFRGSYLITFRLIFDAPCPPKQIKNGSKTVVRALLMHIQTPM